MGFFDGVRKLKAGARLLRDPKALLGTEAGRAARDEVDQYVNQKLDEARILAGGLAEKTLEKAKSEATLFLDVIERRVDAKLVELEKLIEARLQRELYIKLVALRWTLFFVVLMSVISLGYLLLKQRLLGGP